MKRLSFGYHLSSLLAVFVLFFFVLPQPAHAAAVWFNSGFTQTTASGFVGDTTFTVYVNGANIGQTWIIYWASTATGTTVNLGSCSTGLGSTCNTAITIPHSSKGNWLIHGNRNGSNTAAITFTVNPKITSRSPASGVFGTSVNVAGTGFAAESVTAKLGASTLGSMTPTSGTGGVQGDFSVTAGAQDMIAGANAVSATGTLSGDVSSAFTFTMSPTISLSSSSGFPGQSTNVSGHGFAGSSTVTITQNGANSSYTNTSSSVGALSATTFYPTGSSGAQNIGAKDSVPNTAPNVTYTLTAGNLSLTSPGSATLNPVTIAASIVTGTGNLGDVTAIDQRGTLPGWNLTATSTNFSSASAAQRISGVNNTVSTDPTCFYNSGIAGTYTITITTGGAVGVAKFGVTGLETASNQTTGSGVAIGTRGVTATFGSATYSVGDSWNIRTDIVPVTGFTITPGSVTLVEGPTNDVTGGSAHTFTGTSDPMSLITATSGRGSGKFKVNPSLSIDIPVGSYANAYKATITETIN